MHRSRHRRHSRSHSPDYPRDPEKEKKRYYLFPGQGGKLYHRKQKFILKWSIIAALAVAGILAAVMYWMNRSGRF